MLPKKKSLVHCLYYVELQKSMRLSNSLSRWGNRGPGQGQDGGGKGLVKGR